MHKASLQCYRKKGCRRNECRELNRLAQWELYAKRSAERIMIGGYLVHPRAIHGTSTGYRYYGCRCDACRYAKRNSR